MKSVACPVIGTFCMLSVRRFAVTMTSCSWSLLALALALSPGAAKTIAVAGALRIAATAAEIFGLGFIQRPPRGLVVISPLERIRLPNRRLPVGLLYHAPAACLNNHVIHA